jgi:anaerobic selenocysteine-containing dehydrogenase
MASMTEAFLAGRIQVLLLFGTNLMSSFADANAMAAGLARVGLVVSHDLFMNDTARRFADIVLPSTAWLEELGCKMTNTHLYLMEQALAAPGETRSLTWIMRALADRLGLSDFFPWSTDEAMIDALLDHPATGHATVAALRAQGGIGELRISHVAHPDLRFSTPSGKVEFYAQRAVTRHAAFTSVYGIARHGAGSGAGPGPHVDALP